MREKTTAQLMLLIWTTKILRQFALQQKVRPFVFGDVLFDNAAATTPIAADKNNIQKYTCFRAKPVKYSQERHFNGRLICKSW